MIKFQISADNCDGGIKPKCNFEMMQFLIKHEDDWLTGWLAGWSVFMEINSSFFQFQKLVFSLWCVSFLLRHLDSLMMIPLSFYSDWDRFERRQSVLYCLHWKSWIRFKENLSTFVTLVQALWTVCYVISSVPIFD